MKPRRGLVEANGAPSMRRQCELLGVNRSSLYYEPVEPDTEELELMRRMDELHLKHPFFGSRMMTRTLKAEGVLVNRKRVQRLMRLMGLASTAPKPNTSKPAPEHAVYPYLLRNLKVSRINQVWAADITYIPMARGFVFLMAIIDWYSRRVLALALVHHVGDELLRGGPTRSPGTLRLPRDFQHGPGLSVHLGGFHRRTTGSRDQDQHGWQGAFHRQHLRRAALALAEVRGGLPLRLRQRASGSRGHRSLLRFFQRRASARGQVLIFLSNLRMAPRARVYAADSFDVSCGRSSFRSSSTFLAVKTSILTPRHLFATAKRTAKESFIAASSVKK